MINEKTINIKRKRRRVFILITGIDIVSIVNDV
jgi:hypothetical protein